MYYVHKYQIALQYGGPEEGGWWYEAGTPTGFVLGPLTDEEGAYDQAYDLNKLEQERRKREEQYDYTSVLAKLSSHYSYTVSTDATPLSYPATRPHYE